MTSRSAIVALWIVATAAIVAGIYFFRDSLTQFALALVLWLVMDGLARWLHQRLPVLPEAATMPFAIVVVLSLVVFVVWIIAQNLGNFTLDANGYESRLDRIIADAYGRAGLPGLPPTVAEMAARADPRAIIGQIAEGVRGLASDLVFILIYLGFLFTAAAMMPRKLDAIFQDPAQRQHVREVLHSIRSSIDSYLYVQTVMSLLISTLTYGSLVLIGLQNALFWAFLIFFLNYIPTIGSIVAVALPTAFALVQFTDAAHIAAVALGVGVWQFAIGNFVQPRMTGESLNLSAIVVLLALAIWGSLWGVAGAFLAAPLTVMLMIVFAQFNSTRWIAILLSENARPAVFAKSEA